MRLSPSLSCSLPDSSAFAYYDGTLLAPTQKPTPGTIRTHVGLLAICVLSVACRRPASLTLHDTESREFSARLDEATVTDLILSGAPEAAKAYELRRSGRLVAACPKRAGAASNRVTQCRALVCSADSQCPPAHGLTQGTCINGLCIEPSQNLISDDAVMLCLSGTGAGYGSPLQVERFALGLNCGQPCRVPSPCRQP